ncbi:hypothetical protein PSYJA_47143, partial [Pseudomonas syringae pv. japonica str. M301072]
PASENGLTMETRADVLIVGAAVGKVTIEATVKA